MKSFADCVRQGPSSKQHFATLRPFAPKVLELVEKEEIGDGIHSELDLMDRFPGGPRGQRVADLIHMDATVDSESAEADAWLLCE